MRRRRVPENGFSLLELLLTCGLVVTLSAAAIPQTLANLDEARAEAAARHLASRVQWARWQAAARGSAVGIRFEKQEDGGYRCVAYVDGNHNGIRTRDIDQGTDSAFGPSERLADLFAGTEFALADGVPPVGTVRADDDRNPIRLGRSAILSISPIGTATSGTVYIRAGRTQTAVRILGATGRARVMTFDRATLAWRPR